MSTKTHWKKVFDSDYLGACDIEPGTELKVKIEKVKIEKVKGGKVKGGQNADTDNRNVAHFTEKGVKPMVLNATNCKQIRKFAKSEFIEDWGGVCIQIYVKQVKAFGEETEGLRIRDFQPKIGRQQLLPNTTEWAGAVKFLKEGNTIDKIRSKYDLTDENQTALLAEAI